jgi:glycosyltransferase involved in cell wall biosynthesis
MKILLLQDYLRSGGTERQTVLLANAFAAAGHKVTLLTFRPGGALADTVSSAVMLKSLQSFDTRFDWFAPGLLSLVERQSPDIILCMGRMANCYGQSLVKRTQGRRPKSVVIGTMRTGKSLPCLFRRSLRRVSHVIANSNAAKTTLIREHELSPEKISVIRNSMVFPAQSPLTATKSLRAQHGAAPTTTVLLNVAMFRPEKNQRELIKIASGLPPDFDWQLWLVGDGPSRPACMKLAVELGVNPRVKFLGFHPDPTTLYASADLAVHASSSESLSNFLIEAQSHGLPAIAYDAQGIGECFIPGETGEVIPRDQPDAFRAAILRYASPSLACREHAAAYAREQFDPARQIEAYLTLFAALTGQS